MPAEDIKVTHNGQVYSFQLTRGEQGVLDWLAGISESIIEPLGAEEVGHAQFQTSLVSVLGSQERNTGGYGQLIRDTLAAADKYADSSGADARWPDGVFGGPLLTTYTVPPNAALNSRSRGWAKFNGKVFVAGGRAVYYWDTDLAAFVLAYDPGIPCTCTGLTIYKGNLLASYIDDADAASYAYTDTGDLGDWTESNRGGADQRAHGFLVVDDGSGTGPLLWKWLNPSSLHSTTDPTNPGIVWSAATVVGDTGTKITALVTPAEDIMICRSDGVIGLTSAGVTYQAITDLRSRMNDNNGLGSFAWNGHLIYLLASGEVLVYTADGVIVDISPTAFAGVLGAVKITAGVGDVHFLYLSGTDGSSSKVFSVEIHGDYNLRSSWIWHPIAEIPQAQIGAMFISDAEENTPKLWLADDYPAYLRLPNRGYPLQDTSYPFAASWKYTTPYLYGKFHDLLKALYYVRVAADLLTLTETFTIDYQIDNDTTWRTDLTPSVINSANISRNSITLTFPTGLVAQRIRLRFTGARGTTITLTPRLLSYAVYGRIITPHIWQASFSILVRDMLHGLTAASIRSLWMETFPSSEVSPDFTLTDPFESDKQVSIIGPYPQESYVVNQRGDMESIIKVVVAQKVTY